MSDLVPKDQIEGIVGAERHEAIHYARAVSAEQTVYILHSRQCVGDVEDLRDCPFSLALDCGIDADEWPQDVAVPVRVEDGLLVPAIRADANQGKERR